AELVQYLNVASTEQAERLQSVRWGLTAALEASVQSLERAIHDLDNRRLSAESELRSETSSADAELRTSLAVLQRASQMVQRELSQIAGQGVARTAAATSAAIPPSAPSFDSHKYV